MARIAGAHHGESGWAVFWLSPPCFRACCFSHWTFFLLLFHTPPLRWQLVRGRLRLVSWQAGVDSMTRDILLPLPLYRS